MGNLPLSTGTREGMAEVVGPREFQRISPQNVNSSPPEPTEYPQNIIESRESYVYRSL